MKFKEIFKKKLFWIGLGVIIILGLLIFVNIRSDEKSFETDSILLKLSVKQGDSFKKDLIIKDLDIGGNYKIESDLGFISIEDSEFDLERGGEKNLELNFDIKDKEPGIYSGTLVFLKNRESLDVPIILEIETEEVLFDSIISVPPEYSKVYIGDKLVVENKIFNLENIGSKSVHVNYFIKDFKGKTIFSENENMVVENQILSSKVIQIPKGTEEGNYLLGISMDYSDSFGSSSYFFAIEHREINFGKMNFWIVFILLLVVLVFVIYNTFQRNMFLLELERQRRRELKTKVHKEKKEKVRVKRIKHIGKRKKKLKEISKKHRKTVRVINKVYKTRARTLKRLKKQKKKSEIQKRLRTWKKQGVNIGEFAIGASKKEDSGKRADKFKKQGYKLG